MSARLLKIATLFFVMAGLSLACSKGVSSPATETPGITEAVKTYVKEVKKIEVTKLDIAIKDLKIDGDKAQCQASFSLKEQKDMAFTYAYSLEKKAGKWAVISSSSAGQSHGGVPEGMGGGMEGGMPPGHPPMGDANAPMGSPHGGMPSHPAVGEGMPSPHGTAPAPANAPAK